METLTTMFMLSGFGLGVWLMFIPWFIYREIKSQGEAREREAAHITALLRIIASGETYTPSHHSFSPEPLQAAIDAQPRKCG